MIESWDWLAIGWVGVTARTFIPWLTSTQTLAPNDVAAQDYHAHIGIFGLDFCTVGRGLGLSSIFRYSHWSRLKKYWMDFDSHGSHKKKSLMSLLITLSPSSISMRKFDLLRMKRNGLSRCHNQVKVSHQPQLHFHCSELICKGYRMLIGEHHEH